jgi:hypothetical protein
LLLPGEERYHDRQQEEDDAAEAGRWGLCHMPLCGTASAPPAAEGAGARTPSGSGAKVIRSLLPTRRRLRLDPPAKLYFPCTPRRTENSVLPALAICPRETRASWLSIDFLVASCCFLEKKQKASPFNRFDRFLRFELKPRLPWLATRVLGSIVLSRRAFPCFIIVRILIAPGALVCTVKILVFWLKKRFFLFQWFSVLLATKD